MSPFSAIVIGDESLLVSCSDLLFERGHRVTAVVTRDPANVAWADKLGLPVLDHPRDLAPEHAADWLFSIANLRMIGQDTLKLGRMGAINFHDGPLPEYAGLNAPAWAILNGETKHAVSWHLMETGIDTGDILASQAIEITEQDTAFSLNTKCYAAGIESFERLVTEIEGSALSPTPQDAGGRSYFARDQRPTGAGRLNFGKPAEHVAATVRALDFGSYANPLTCPKVETESSLWIVGAASVVERSGAPGAILETGPDWLDIACTTGAVRLSGLRDLSAAAVDPRESLSAGDLLPINSDNDDAALRSTHETIARHESFWRRELTDMTPMRLAVADQAVHPADWQSLPVDLQTTALGAIMLWARISCGAEHGAGISLSQSETQDVADAAPRYLSNWTPLCSLKQPETKADLESELQDIVANQQKHASFARDLLSRHPSMNGYQIPDIALADGTRPVEGTVVTVTPDTGQLHYDARRIDTDGAQLILERLETIAQWWAQTAEDARLSDCPTHAPREDTLFTQWNNSAASYDHAQTIPAAFQAQVAKTPEATAIVYEDQSITYEALDARANAIAQALINRGVTRGDHVGLHCRRCIDMVSAALGIMKSGAAYVPLDPTYPADRIQHYVTDSAARIIVTQADIAHELPAGAASHLLLDSVPQTAEAPTTTPASEDTAYLIYTSGSTGLPKGVMVTHRNVINFFTGMDAEIDPSLGQTWAAVTSMAFDISVLELFYTLSRGFKLVLMGDENRAAVSGGPIRLPGKKVDFSLFYWGNDDGVGRDKYTLLLEGAKFADGHGFNAVWTPERHFHAFGGPYPNPSVTGAAVAAVTRNLSVRAGSCVAPLHHTARIAEEWSVIDNLTNGRAGLAIASGWQPDDFVLRPENTPPENKPAMYRAIDDLRKLWRGETVSFPKADGTDHAVLTQPRPVSPDLPIWVTTAGNPATWREAGEIGANVLTHLLGQNIDEVADKIDIYHDALRGAGHDPDDFSVTLMLHTYLAGDRDTARSVARGPMKDYLRSAAGLIKQYAWAFPAFKRPQGVSNPFEMDLGTLSEDELEAILDFAFERYFEESGLFGTVEDAVARVEALRRIGVTEVACLIDYGIPVPQVMEGLRPLARVLKEVNAPAELDAQDFSLAAQILRHNVSHLQCTPSMAGIIAMNDEARLALSGVKQLLLGGEALPGSLIRDLRHATRARITNMYGPTETTIWSSMQHITDDSVSTAPLGQPIANTQLLCLGKDDHLSPIGVPGELCIGGDGVTRGYWNRPELTSEKFVALPDRNGLFYRTGDLVCRRVDGTLEFLGRNDNQVKIRGQRIELGEIEAAMTQLPGLSQAVVVARETSDGGIALVGYFTTSSPVLRTELHSHLAATLPQAMVPSALIELDEFPLTPNRKIDRKALPDHGRIERPEKSAASDVKEDSTTQQRIAAIWTRILGVDNIRSEDNFFALGGHSLLAVQAHRDIRAELDATDLSITDIFRFPTLGALVTHLDVGSKAGPDSEPDNTAAASRGDVMSKRKAMRAQRAAKVG